jgi:hypothetical protein
LVGVPCKTLQCSHGVCVPSSAPPDSFHVLAREAPRLTSPRRACLQRNAAGAWQSNAADSPASESSDGDASPDDETALQKQQQQPAPVWECHGCGAHLDAWIPQTIEAGARALLDAAASIAAQIARCDDDSRPRVQLAHAALDAYHAASVQCTNVMHEACVWRFRAMRAEARLLASKECAQYFAGADLWRVVLLLAAEVLPRNSLQMAQMHGEAANAALLAGSEALHADDLSQQDAERCAYWLQESSTEARRIHALFGRIAPTPRE